MTPRDPFGAARGDARSTPAQTPRTRAPSIRQPGPALALAAGLLAACLTACDGGHDGEALSGADPLHGDAPPLTAAQIELPPLPKPLEGVDLEPAVAPPPFSPGIFPCSRCHGTPAPPADAPSFPHQTHLDGGLGCGECHDQGGPEPAVPGPEMCVLCHDDAEGPVGEVLAAMAEPPGDETPAHRWWTEDVIANHAGHEAVGVDCAQCHGEPSDAPFAKPGSAVLMQECIDCHQQRGAPAECATCHERTTEPAHADIVLKHSSTMTGCYQCHHPDDRDSLRLASGKSIPFERSYELCGQCHGPKLRDWREGLHGKRLGSWDGARKYLLCVHCHSNPHDPAFPDMEAYPPPMRPEDIR